MKDRPERIFTMDDQRRFAVLSGDFNPIHVDPLTARRSAFGRPLVHGVHSLLWGLDRWSEAVDFRGALTALKVRFPKAIGIGEPLRGRWERARNEARIKLTGDGVSVCSISLAFVRTGGPSATGFLKRHPRKRKPQEHTMTTLRDARGTLPLALDPGAARRLFPALSRRIPLGQIADIASTTRLVGMVCPGLQSLFSELDLHWSGPAPRRNIEYEVNRADERFGLVRMRLWSDGLSGTIGAFVRPGAFQQPSYAEVAAGVGPSEFAAQDAIVLGGSRGLGEVTAKILTAGGADVHLSYRVGRREADAIVGDIRAGGGKARAFQFDVLSGDLAGLGARRRWKPTHLYYFPTPPILIASRSVFSERLFRQFSAFYVEGFMRSALAAIGMGTTTIFYPSSVMLEERPPSMTEYVAAKAAGEAACEMLEKNSRNVRVLKPRLPRLATDQTLSLSPVENGNPVEHLLTVLRSLVA